MKIAKFLLGLLFAVWAIGTLAIGIRDMSMMAASPGGISKIAASAAATATLALFSVWFFQSALGKNIQT